MSRVNRLGEGRMGRAVLLGQDGAREGGRWRVGRMEGGNEGREGGR